MALRRSNKSKPGQVNYVTKKCPECYAYVKMEAEVCPYCKTKIGKVGPHGMAVRKVDWKSYLSFGVALVALVVYIWWAFFRE